MSATVNPQVSRAPRPGTALAIICGMVLLPALYVVASRGDAAKPVAAAQVVAPKEDLQALARRVSAEPSFENRGALAEAYLKAKLPAQAMPLLTRLISERPRSAELWNNLCFAHMLQQEVAAAVQACETGLEIAPSLPILQANWKWVSDERARVRTALAEAARVREQDRTAAYFMDVGLDHLHLGEYDAAIAAWQQSLRFDPRAAAAESNVGVAQMMQGRFAPAAAHFQKAVQLAPQEPLYRNNLAWAQAKSAGAP